MSTGACTGSPGDIRCHRASTTRSRARCTRVSTALRTSASVATPTEPMTPNLGAALRDWLNARDLRRWQRRGALPPSLDRSYWSFYEYHHDLGRLQRCGYHVTVERATRPYPDLTPNITALSPRMVRARGAHSVMLYRVSYSRLSAATWGPAIAAARRT